MKNSAFARLEKISKPSVIFFLLFLFIIFQLTFQMGLMPRFEQITNQSRILDFELVKSGDVAPSIIAGYGKTGVSFYNYIQIVDTIYPIAYSLLLASLICYLLKGAAKRYRIFCFLPFAGALSDYLENLGIFLMLRIHPNPIQNIASVAHVMSVFKFGFIALSILIVILLGIFSIAKFALHLFKTAEGK